MRILLAGLCAGALALAGCGGTSAPTTTGATTAATVVPRIRVAIVSPTHTPKANVGWPVKITVTEAGKPVAATLTMRVLFGGQPVGKIDNGAVYHFVGTWQEKPDNLITWPPASRGQPLTFQAVVRAQGVTVRKSWAIRVR